MNAARYFLPHLLALSTSSPFWMGRDTGLKSYRTTIFRRFPRTGVPDHFGSWSEYENYVKLLVELHCIDDAQEDLVGRAAAPDVRHARVPRLRRADASGGSRRCSAALAQAIIVKLHKLYARNLGFRLYRRALIEENKWRAARWGLDGKLIDFGKRAEVPMRDLALELLEFVDDVVDELGSRRSGRVRAHGPAGGHERRPAARGLSGDRRPEGRRAAHRRRKRAPASIGRRRGESMT